MADSLTTWSLAAETKEFVGPIVVTADGATVPSFEVAFTLGTARPTTWASADDIDGDLGIIVGTGTSYALAPGNKYTVWVRFTDSPEVPVFRVAYVRAT